MLRGHHADHDLRGVEREVQIAGRFDRFRQDEPRQEAFIDSAFCDALANFQFVGPEPDMVPDTVRDMVCPFASQDDCQAGAPGACSDDGNAAHLRVAPDVSDFVPDLVPNFDSVPLARRPMFWRCFQITSAETRAIKTSCRESAYSWKAQASKGKAAATATEPSET